MEASSRRAFKAQQRSADPATAKAPSRAGRNLPAAIAVGVALGALVIATALLYRPAFVALVTIVAVIGSLELVNALRTGRINAPLVPVLIGALALVPLAYVGGSSAYLLGYGLVALTVLVWRALDGPTGAVRDVAGGVFIVTYVGLAGFAALMLAEPDGGQRIIVFALLTTMSDIGGYAVGVLFGKHPMAPSISPKKSWEGFAGSVLTSVVAGAISVPLLLGGDWWAGALLGVPIAFFATVGDLSESTIKRDLGIKDMGNVLPGHGGVMDRLDSLLITAPVAWVLLSVLVPA
ncbi:phosphatidate cytidylyltransferase [Ornithinimicrobium cryptoxanthini]|uniref:Phosphatidate cytidylyltransferase n=1 Tax=Ornithinimicrobium cryptoxanthini TaxID=2934161 RepID=A0ABY4YEI7_9MICO|nr:phosphatidate cytidylyltransferase [Ornithinimicrobium cryptoxanthini]USQ75181.1 phosphatidate cytidylyltransferase [Ornithinimicrobium cryptoxanthini]